MTKNRPPILEAAQTPEPGKVYTLCEDFVEFTIVKDPYKVSKVVDEATGLTRLIETKRGDDELMEIEGVFQRSDVKNANRRVYPRSIWERWTKADSDLMRRVSSRQCLGEIEHPKDGAGNLANAAILTTGLTLESDGTVRGRAQVLNTPCGRVVRDLLRDGVKIGVSSRGTGSVDARGYVDESTYRPETWDVVGNPSTPGAYPAVVERPAIAEGATKDQPDKFSVEVTESAGRTVWTVLDENRRAVRSFESTRQAPGERTMSTSNARTRLDALTSQIRAHLASDITESPLADLHTLEKALNESAISTEQLALEDGTLRPVVKGLQEEIDGKRREIRESMSEKRRKPVVEGKKDKDDEDDGDDEEDDGDEDDRSDESAADITLDEALELLGDARDLIEDQSAKIEAQDETIAEMAEQLAVTERTIAELQESLAANDAVLAEMSSDDGEGESADGKEPTVAEAVEEVLKTHPRIAESREFLARCDSAKEVRTLAERLAGAARPPQKGLPPVPGRNSVNEQRGDGSANTRRETGDGEDKSKGALLVERMLVRVPGANKAVND